jgi:hypothetical protein
MSQEVDRSKPLSDQDREYLLSRNMGHVAEQIDALHANSEPADDGDGGEDVLPYEEWSAADLRAEIDDRNADRDDAAKISKAGKNAELAARLHEDDARA